MMASSSIFWLFDKDFKKNPKDSLLVVFRDPGLRSMILTAQEFDFDDDDNFQLLLEILEDFEVQKIGSVSFEGILKNITSVEKRLAFLYFFVIDGELHSKLFFPEKEVDEYLISKIKELRELEKRIEKIKNVIDKFSLKNSKILAIIINDFLGGDIMYCKHKDYYWNKLPNGIVVDYLGKSKECCFDRKMEKEFLLTVESFQKSKLFEAYVNLKKMLTEELKKENLL